MLLARSSQRVLRLALHIDEYEILAPMLDAMDAQMLRVLRDYERKAAKP